MSLPNKAAWVPQATANLTVGPAPYPFPVPKHSILVKNESLAINPVEAAIQKYAIFLMEYPAILGSSFAGTVKAIGSSVKSFKVGDRVVVSKAFSNPSPLYGVYQQYALALPPYVSKLQDSTSLDDAAAIVSNLATTVGALTIAMGLDRPPLSGSASTNGKKLLVYGGSSSIGGLAVQYATQAGYTVITTSSLRNMSTVEQYGAAKVINHTQKTENILAAIEAEGPYDGIFDTIALPSVVGILSKYLEAHGGGVIYAVQPPPDDLPAGVERKFFTYPGLLEDEANDEIRKWLFEEYLPKSLAEKRIIPTKVEKVSGGLCAIQGVLDKYNSTGVSGVKLVVDPFEED
ncbi:GroES-like protein [Tothia fuscella]|uniref:GroES-like protein n=1 Tax=Tothia fuscella TaxID=1048955 RepID=A0A9P4U0C0_9PEZI|nr:GroES-like protein [Tothia fuscella]